MKEFNLKITGHRLKKLRKENGFSQKELARQIGISQNTISQYENGTAKPSIKVIFKLIIILNTDANYLLGLCN